MNTKTFKTSALTVALLAAFAVGHFTSDNQILGDAQASTPAATSSVDAKNVTAVQSLPDMSRIVAKNGAAVVNISVSGKSKNAAQEQDFSQFDPEDPFFEFFKRFRVPQQQGEQVVRGQGSGFILRDDGIILTNAHVVQDADEVTVKLIDKREFKAKVLGADKATDVAVLKIEAKNLPSLSVGSSTDSKVGEWVLAIGSPFGFENSATAGIISAKSRALPSENYVPFIQTDVAVNPGNSGGPLFNMKGEVIGINSQIYSRSGGYQGLSFAIPIEVAMNIEEQIVKHGKVQRGRLGVTIQEVNQSLAESFGLKKPGGALVSSVEDDSPAGKAGLVPGDVILGMNGNEITASSELPPLVATIKPGESAKLRVWRKGSEKEIDVKVEAMQDDKQLVSKNDESGKAILGVNVRPLNAEEKRQLELSVGGLFVENASGAAAKAGVRRGDVILSVNGEVVSSVSELQKLISSASKRVALLIQRGNAKLFVPVELG